MSSHIFSYFDFHPDFTANSGTTTDASSGNFILQYLTGLTVNVASSISTSDITSSYSIITQSYQLNSSLSYDILVMLESESYLTLTENSSIHITPNVTCKGDATTAIIYSLASYNSVMVPSWITIDSSNGNLNVNTPSITSASDLAFYIKSTVSGTANPTLKLINIRVNKCAASNCNKCNPADYMSCAEAVTCGNGVLQTILNEQCDDGNTKSDDGCSGTCLIESGYYCVQLPTNNVSYCTKTCGNSHIDSGEDCDDGNSVLGDGCDANCKYEIGFKCHNYIDKPSFCYPNCGDGIRDTDPFNEQCDDGNNMDLDGCSGDCKVETNYVCNSGVHGDICKTIFSAPIIKNSIFDSKLLQVTIEFDQIMLQQNLTSFDLSVDISGPNSPYSVSWTTTFDKAYFKINLSSTPVLLGGVNEIVLVQLIDVSKFKSEHNISMLSTNLFSFKISGLPPSDSTKNGGSGASYMLIFAMLLSIGVSLFTGGSIELMWSLANTLQILFYLGMLNLYYTPELQAVFLFMKYSNFDNPAFEYIKIKIKSILTFVSTTIPSNFGSLGFPSVSIVTIINKNLTYFKEYKQNIKYLNTR